MIFTPLFTMPACNNTPHLTCLSECSTPLPCRGTLSCIQWLNYMHMR